VKQSRKNGINIQTVIGNSAYLGKNNLEKAHDERFDLVAKLTPYISQGIRKEKDKFNYNKETDMIIHPDICLYVK
jgi:transposase